MKKHLIICLFCAMAVWAVAQNHTPQWVQELASLNAGLIDSIVPYPAKKTAPEYASYMIYYHRPLSHANPLGAQFPMRALLTVDTRQDPVAAVNHVYFSGYNIATDYVDNPNETLKADGKECRSEIALRYRGNYIQPEHRYFGFSEPDRCWTNLDYCTADEASEDFHALFEALKKVLRGKWAISGVSKGGITTALQHMYHPEDADIFLPYSAPFFDTDRDTVMQHYWYNNGWNQDYLDMFMNIRRQALYNNRTIYPIYEKMTAGRDTSAAHLDSIYGRYLMSTAQFGYEEHTYEDTATIRRHIYDNDSILRSCGMTEYNDTAYAYMIYAETLALTKFRIWLDTLRKYPDRQGPKPVLRRQHRVPFGITETQWIGTEDVPQAAYYYQAKCELGSFDYRFDEIVGRENAGSWNAYWQSHYTCALDLLNPHFASLTFNPALYGRLTSATQNATKPVVFIYGLDDTWTGAAMKDEFINGTNVRKFILPAQNHMVCFNSKTDPVQCSEIMRILDEVLGTPQGIESPSLQERSGEATKILQNGQLIIIRNNEKYDITGKKL